MHPRSAKYFKSDTDVFGPKDSMMELGEAGVGTGEGATTPGEPGGALTPLTAAAAATAAAAVAASSPDMSKADVC